MTPERWQSVKTLLEDALELPDGEREGFVAGACPDDAALRREVLDLLTAATEVGDFIETPAATLLGEAEGSLAADRRLGPYRVIEEIGRGGMGTVYLAARADDAYEKRVAIKVVRRGMDSEEIVRRFRQERQILANLVHPNIGGLLDGGTSEDGLSYFVMEHVLGVPIDEYCRDHDLPEDARLALFRTVCSAVHFAHQNLVVHRDLKPANILVTQDGVPKLLDFGIAKLLQTAAPFSTQIAQPGLRLMTPEYASPEQQTGGQITTATDVYGLGLLLHLLLAGRLPGRSQATAGEAGPPQAAESPTAPTLALAEKPPTPPSRPLILLRGELKNIVAMSLREEPTRRYASAQALADDIDRHLTGLPVAARPDTWGYRTGKFIRRNRAGVVAASLFLIVLVAFGIDRSIQLRTTRVQKMRAETVSGFLEEIFRDADPSKSRGETITAREMLDQNLGRIQKGLEAEPETRAEVLEMMGRSYNDLGVYPQAQALFEKAVALRRKIFGNEDPKLAESLFSLANAYRHQNLPLKAERLLREAVGIQQRHLAPDDPELARGLNNLGSFLSESSAKDLPEAERVLKDALSIKRRLYIGDQVDLAMGYHNLARVWQKEGHLVRAELWYSLALAMRLRLLGDAPDPEVAKSLNTLASVREDLGDDVGAESLYGQALAMRRKLNPGSPDVARSCNNLARLLAARGDPQAAALYREALDICDRRHIDPASPERAIYLRNYASLLSRDAPATAEPLARQAFNILSATKSTGYEDAKAEAESVLGGCLTGLHRYAEAEPLLVDADERLANSKSDGPRPPRAARQRLIDLYTAWNRRDLAARYKPLP